MSSSIEWTDETWNPAVGCSRVSAGCEHCYAEMFVHRGLTEAHRGLTVLGKHGPRWNGTVRFLPERLETPLRWKKPRRVFVNSLSDLFHEALTNEQIAAVFGVMAACPQHTFQVLTKRATRMREWFAWAEEEGRGQDLMRDGMPNALLACAWAAYGADFWTDEHPSPFSDVPDAERFGRAWPLANVHLGVSVENQATADERIPDLLSTPAAVRWVSYEPALGPVNICAVPDSATRPAEYSARYSPLGDLDWLVVGGESGAAARPFDLRWARSLIALCREARTPVFVKQLGAWPVGDVAGDVTTRRALRDRKGGDISEWPEDLRVRMYPGDTWPAPEVFPDA